MRKVKFEIYVSTIHDGVDYEPVSGFVSACRELLAKCEISGATITKGFGVWENNNPEKTWLISISDSAFAYERIVRLCLKLCAAFRQDCVMLGVVHSAYDEFFIGGVRKGDDGRIFETAVKIYENQVKGALGV